MMVVKTPIFVDTNILIQMHVATAPKHRDVQQAIKRLTRGNSELWISRQVIREYAAVLTRHQPYTSPLSPGDVSNQIRLFEAQYRVADENTNVTKALCKLMDNTALGGKQIHDANIVATMQVYAIGQLLTLNVADFKRFSDVITLVILEDLLKDPL